MKSSIVACLFLCACGTDTFVSADSGEDSATTDGATGDGISGCAAGQTSCGGHCVDTSSSVANCGDCGAACVAIDAGAASCMNGTCLYPMGDTACVAVNATDVFWTNGRASDQGGGVFRMPRGKAAAKPTRVAAAQHFPHGIAAADTQVFWTTSGDVQTNGAVRRAKPDGTAPADVASTSTTGAREPGPVTLANNQVYWGNTLNSSIWQGSTDGTAAPAFVSFTSGTPTFLTSTPISLYWTANLSANGGTGSVGRYIFKSQVASDMFTQPNDTFGAVWVSPTDDNTVCLARFQTKQVTCGLWAVTGPTYKTASGPAWSLTATNDGSFVYWAERISEGNIVRYDGTALTSSTLATDDTPNCVAIDDLNLYWTARGRLVPGVIAR